jgi:hypothetical protein
MAASTKSYRQLDPQKIFQTVDLLHKRIEDRFPGSGLGKLVSEIVIVAREAMARVEWFRRPHLPLRIGITLLVTSIGLLCLRIILDAEEFRVGDFSSFIQVLEAGISAIVFIGAAILFLVTCERRLKRVRGLRAVHELRALAHIIDMHQLTKDPERVVRPGGNTPASPKRVMTAFEMNRYFDYCSEALSLLSKIAALYVQGFEDEVVLEAVDDLEGLVSGLSQKIWQKITLLDLLQHSQAMLASEGAAASSPPQETADTIVSGSPPFPSP